MRIIAGIRKGHKLLGPLNGNKETKVGDPNATRPTLDRVKEAMFSIINHKIYASTVLDLFAGTGSLGLECASRGAKEVILCDNYKETYDLLVENIDKLRFNKECKTMFSDYKDSLNRLSREKKTFNIIFIDPPYLNNMIPPCLEYINKEKLLEKDGVIVTKVDSGEIILEESGDLEMVMSRKYGNTTLVFYQWKEN